MSYLLSAQRAVQSYLLESNSSLNTNASDSVEAIDSLIAETDRVPRSVRLNIYANAYRTRLIEALSVDFSGLHTYLGDAAFAELAHGYIEQYPSHSFSVRNLGGSLAKFLRETSPYAEHVELSELAEFEWALCYAFDAADSKCAEFADFSAIPTEQWPELTLQFVPASSVIEMCTNAPAIWKSLNAEQAPPAAEIAAEKKSWIVWRRDLTLLFRPFDALEKSALDVFARGGTFADVCGELVEMLSQDQVPADAVPEDKLPENEVPQRAAAMLQQWLSDGLIAAP